MEKYLLNQFSQRRTNQSYISYETRINLYFLYAMRNSQTHSNKYKYMHVRKLLLTNREDWNKR